MPTIRFKARTLETLKPTQNAQREALEAWSRRMCLSTDSMRVEQPNLQS